jgi:hypothetical protein
MQPADETATAFQPFPIFLPFPVSGLYTWSSFQLSPLPVSVAAAEEASDQDAAASAALIPDPTPLPIRREQLRLDVDSTYPQRIASGTVQSGLAGRVHWIARLTAAAGGGWTGTIFYKDGDASLFPYTTIRVTVQRTSVYVAPASATITFSGGGGIAYTRVLRYTSRYFHNVNMEFDNATNATVNLDFNTAAHPNRPASLPLENITIPEVFRRAGFDVATSAGNSIVPLAGAGADTKWSNQEMHDSMIVHWSQNASYAKWAVWVFFASLHEWGTGLGGIMFDDIGARQRQGTAIFNDSFIKTPNPPQTPALSPAWIDRMNFWTAVHEIGHTFNLAHAWQKSLVYNGKGPWLPLTDVPEARTFMNYPYNVAGGTNAFFSTFDYRFIDQELLFMRHAPERFVRHGDALWFDHHGFEQANESPDAPLLLEIRIDKPQPYYEFLEPVVIELRLTNVSGEPQLVPENLLRSVDQLTAVVKRDGDPAKLYAPFARFCWKGNKIALQPGESIADSLFVGAGATGWTVSEPGDYTIQVALEFGDAEIVSNPLRIRVAVAESREEERLGQDYFTKDVARVLAFDGSKVLTDATDTLQAVIDRFPNRNAAIHAAIPLALAASRTTQQLSYEDGAPKIVRWQADPALAAAALVPLADNSRAVATLGALDYDYYAERLNTALQHVPAAGQRIAVRGAAEQKKPAAARPGRNYART